MKFFKKAFNYFKESREELTKVVWPTRKHVAEITLVVIILVIIVSIFLGFYDYFYSKLLTWFLSFKK
jgi:preprotein translocase subunit SecE